MAHINYDYLKDSFLFQSGLEDNFSNYSDAELRTELDKYREHILGNIDNIRAEVTLDKCRINVTIESFEMPQQSNCLKRLSELAYQMKETNISAIDQEMKKIKHSIGVDASILTGSLLASCIGNNNGSVAGSAMSIAGLISGMFVLAKDAREDIKGLLDIKDRPEYFLWKLEKTKWKM